MQIKTYGDWVQRNDLVLFMDTEGEGQNLESSGFPFSIFSRL